MKTDFKEIESSALELDEKHRAELAKRLIKSLDDEVKIQLPRYLPIQILVRC